MATEDPYLKRNPKKTKQQQKETIQRSLSHLFDRALIINLKTQTMKRKYLMKMIQTKSVQLEM